MSDTAGAPGPASPQQLSMLERVSAMEATLTDFTVEMDILQRIIKKEIKDLKKEVGGGEAKQAKKVKKEKKKAKENRDNKESATDLASSDSSSSLSSSANRERGGDDESYEPEASVTLNQVEAALRKQSDSQQRQLDDYLANFDQRLSDERKRRKKEGEKRYSRLDKLERELKGLKENVMQTLVMDARKVELIQKRDLKIKELEDLLKREEEKERQLTATPKHKAPFLPARTIPWIFVP